MGVLFDYFAADSDEQAAKVIEREAGPGIPDTGSDHVFDTVQLKGVDPVVQLGTLEALLTGTPYDEVAKNERCGHLLAIMDEGELLVLTLTDGVQAALAEATPSRLAEVAVPWSETEEFRGYVTPDYLTEVLTQLSGLASRAQAKGQRLYCWVCV